MTEPRAERRRATALASQLIIGLVVLAAVVWGLCSATRQASPGPQPQDIPAQMAGLKLVSSSTGTQALEELRRMHGQGFGLTGGYVARYQEGAIIWVGEVESTGQAQRLIAAMAEKIARGHPVFSDLQRLQLGGETIYTVKGQGQTHYFYYTGNKTVWLAAPPGREAQLLEEGLRQIH